MLDNFGVWSHRRFDGGVRAAEAEWAKLSTLHASVMFAASGPGGGFVAVKKYGLPSATAAIEARFASEFSAELFAPTVAAPAAVAPPEFSDGAASDNDDGYFELRTSDRPRTRGDSIEIEVDPPLGADADGDGDAWVVAPYKPQYDAYFTAEQAKALACCTDTSDATLQEKSLAELEMTR